MISISRRQCLDLIFFVLTRRLRLGPVGVRGLCFVQPKDAFEINLLAIGTISLDVRLGRLTGVWLAFGLVGTQVTYLAGAEPNGRTRGGNRVHIGEDIVLLVLRVDCYQISLVLGPAKGRRAFVVLQLVDVFETLFVAEPRPAVGAAGAITRRHCDWRRFAWLLDGRRLVQAGNQDGGQKHNCWRQTGRHRSRKCLSICVALRQKLAALLVGLAAGSFRK